MRVETVGQRKRKNKVTIQGCVVKVAAIDSGGTLPSEPLRKVQSASQNCLPSEQEIGAETMGFHYPLVES